MSTLNFTETLQPGTGIAREVRVSAPDGTDRPLWSVAVDIGMKERRNDRSALDITWVGAAGARRGGTFVRAAGESVERAALLGTEPLESGSCLRWMPRGMLWSAEAERGSGYRATLIEEQSQTPVRVPAVAVDYPPRTEVAGADPGPSGTASGAGLPMAIRSACKEAVERDAAMRTWYQPLYAQRIEIAGVVGPGAPEASRLIKRLGPAGIELHSLLLDVKRDICAVMVIAIDRTTGVVGAGVGIEQHLAQAILRALQEALQIRTLLIDLKRVENVVSPAKPIREEIDRARFWAGDEALGAIDAWLDLVPAAGPSQPIQQGRHNWTTLVGRFAVVDLTPRIPVAAQELGWAVARVFCPDLQPLRMSEALEWNGPVELQHNIPHPLV